MRQEAKLAVVSDPWKAGGKSYVRVRCFCGREFDVRVNSLRTGNTTSCGCKRKSSLAARNASHGMAKRGARHPLYQTWANIVQRCTNEGNPKYQDYGGRGITVCQRWRESFAAFLEDVGERPFDGAELDRKDNDKGYEPGNVRWVTRLEQTNNTRANRVVTFAGRSLTVAQWARELGRSYMGMSWRIKNMPLERAMTPKEKNT